MTLLDPVFWRSIAWSLVRTALAGLTPFLPRLFADPAGTLPYAVGMVGLMLIAAVATSLSGIADPASAPWWQVLMSRGLRQFGQYFVAGLVGAVVLSDVDWIALLQGAGASALSTVILAALTIIPADPTAGYVPERIDYGIPDGAEPDGPDEASIEVS